jgi:uncharacterized NAD(P)/FAD-binding protein YdhS
MTCRIVIIGGGFSGAVVALNLLNMLAPAAASVTIVEPRPILGAGLAYSTADRAHRVNVPASRLLVLEEAPKAFETWLKTSDALDDDPAARLPDGRIFPRREILGGYVARLLNTAAGERPDIFLNHVRMLATSVEKITGGYIVTLSDGSAVEADVVVLAVSHPPPGIPRPLRGVAAHHKFVGNPWGREVNALIGTADRLLLVGTALTTADIIASLNNTDYQGEIVAISRRGLLSRQRGNLPSELTGDFTTRPSRTALALLMAVRGTIEAAEAAGSGWEAVIDNIRLQGTDIWAALPENERRRFLRHVRPFWDVHRYRLAPQPASVIARMQAEGRLEIFAARILSATFEDGRFQVKLQRRHRPAHEIDNEPFDVIVNCTGPDHGTVIETNPVLTSLAAAGLLHADIYGLGIATDMSARAINDSGQPAETLFVAGPLARAAFGELMGLPQVSHHAALVAREIANLISGIQEPL